MSNIKLGFKKRLTGSMDDLRTRLRGKREVDASPAASKRSFALLTPVSPVEIVCERANMIESPGLSPQSTHETVDVSTSSISLSSKEVEVFDRYSILPEPSTLLKPPSLIKAPSIRIKPSDLDRPLPPRPTQLEQLGQINSMQFKEHMSELKEEILEAASSMKREEELLVQDLHELESVALSTLREHAPAPLLHKNSTRSTLFARIQCVEHDAYQLRIENEIMSKRVAQGQQMHSEVRDLTARNYQLFKELDAIELQRSPSTQQEMSYESSNQLSDRFEGQSINQHSNSSSTYTSSSESFELCDDPSAGQNWQAERAAYQDEIQQLADCKTLVLEELEKARHECQRLNERIQQAESSYDALYTSFKTVQARYKINFEQIHAHLSKVQPQGSDSDDFANVVSAQFRLMESQKQMVKLQEHFNLISSMLVVKPRQIDQASIKAIFNILEPLLDS